MEINPGGRLDVGDIVGRDREIARYWKVLHRQGLILAAERRIGKTHIVLKMHETGHPGFVTIYQELEAVHSLTELVRALYRAVSQHLPRLGKLKAKAVEVWERVIPKRIGDLDLPHARDNWKLLLTDALTDVLNVFDPDQKVVLIWDEFPLMVYNIRAREGADSAIQLLDVLRHLRQTHAKQLRFLFTGSIGLHLVLRSLRAHGNANAPTNDMHSETVPPMSDTDTRELATRLLCRLDPQPADQHATASRIVEAIGGFPYFVQHIVDQLTLRSHPATPADVDDAVRALILSDHDIANFAYNVARIGTYYDAQEAHLAFAVLDAVASQDDALPIANVTNLVRHKSTAVTDDAVRSICLLLRQDHYLTLDRKGSYGFRFRLLKQWWKENRL